MEQDELLKKRLLDLATKADRQNVYTYTGFLSLAEQSEYHQMERELAFAGCQMFGGAENCERMMLQFGSADTFGYEGTFPIAVLEIRPSAEKFAEELGHRDYLGAILNLGIERSLIGDIVIREKKAWVFCVESIAEFLCDNLTKIRHTAVRCSISSGSAPELAPHLEEVMLNVASGRIDAVAAAWTKLSRSKVTELFREKKIFVNGRLQENVSYQLKEGETLTVRGYGKIIYDGILGETKKGRSRVQIRVYV